ncbi:MAG TPA: carbohydrate ABC transporter permease [Phototrophicaceae bacterium]|jgi:multiple sugar transport system permease protein|nr:carbohydrate ABC transporter permease [Phototrophicaceae bacterium]
MRRFFRATSPLDPSPAWLLLSVIVLAIWLVIVLFPLYWLVITAFKLPVDVASGPKYIPFVDFQPSMHAWHEMLVENGTEFVLRPYINTIVTGITSPLLALMIGSLAAYALTRFDYRPKPGLIATFIGCIILTIILTGLGAPWLLAVVSGMAVFLMLALSIGRRFQGTMNNNDIAFWLISQRMLPPITVIIPLYILYQQFGLLDTLTALIVSYSAANLPIVIWFMRDYFQSIPVEIEESAFIDGASRYQTLWQIVLPLSVPGLVATFLIVLVFCWNEYVMALFLSGANTQTMPLLVSAQNGVRGPQWWNMSVLVILMVGPLILLAIILERYITKGLLVGAIKG